VSNESILQFSDSLLAKAQAMPQVMSAAMSGEFPLDKSPASNNQFLIEGQQGNAIDSKPVAELNVVSPDYFRTLGMPLLSGRTFDGRDRPEKPLVAIVDQSLAQHLWHDQDPLGRRISFDDGKTWTQIVGVIGGVRERRLDQAPSELIYLPFAQYPQLSPSLVARTQGDPMNIARAAVQHLYEVDPNQPAGRIQSLEQFRADSIAAPRLTANLLELFALLALAIAAAGIGGVMALSVSQRTHEIGVRMALGATRGDVMRIALRDALWMVCAGLAIGAPLAFWGKHLAASLIAGLPVASPLPILVAAAIMIAVGLIAAYLPARRAMRVDPMGALRYE
jgi:predicted permease